MYMCILCMRTGPLCVYVQLCLYSCLCRHVDAGSQVQVSTSFTSHLGRTESLLVWSSLRKLGRLASQRQGYKLVLSNLAFYF